MTDERTVERLLRRKARLTARMRRRDLRHHARHERRRGAHAAFAPRARTLTRAAIYRTDLALERLGLIAPAGDGTTNGWVNGATIRPGLNAGYRAGRNLMRGGIIHITAGVNSGGLIQRKGLAQFLLGHPGQDALVQYAEIDAVCYHACEWNHVAFGVEVEKLRVEHLTDEVQIESLATIVSAAAGLGVPIGPYHRGDHDVPVREMPVPYVSHSSLAQRACDRHYDWLPEEDMARVFALAGTEDEMRPRLVKFRTGNGATDPTEPTIWLVQGVARRALRDLDEVAYCQFLYGITTGVEAWPAKMKRVTVET